MTLDEFKDEALTRFTRELSDLFFCYIENDRELMHKYLSVIGPEKEADETNQFLDQAVKEHFGLNEVGENHQPKSKLITSYTGYIIPSEEGVPPAR